jgi:hypothetical protein
MTNNPADRISIHIGGNVTGQVVGGQGNVVNWQKIQASDSVTADDWTNCMPLSMNSVHVWKSTQKNAPTVHRISSMN